MNVIATCAFAYLLAGAIVVHAAATQELRSGTLELDPSRTVIKFDLPGNLHTTRGTFKLERGVITGDPASGKAGGSVVIDANSGDTGMSSRDNHMRANVLETQRYPEIIFEPQHFTVQLQKGDQFQGTMQGLLLLHGGQHDITFPAQGRLVGDHLSATAHLSIPYVKWGLKDPSILFLTVAKQVDIDIAAAGHVVWSDQQSRRSAK